MIIVFLLLLLFQALINLVGALGPELSFDALWYHLPIARLIAERGWWGVIPGGLLYYSGTPRLWEFVNAGLLLVGSETLVKLVHWSFGLLSAGMVYKIARRYYLHLASLAAAALWYSNLVVGWQSIVAYVDLVRTFFVLLGVWYLLESLEKKRPRSWFYSALFLGIAYSVKIISLFDGLLLGLVFGFTNRRVLSTLRYWVVLVPFVLFWAFLNLKSGYSLTYPFVPELGLVSEHFNLSPLQIFGPLFVFFDPRFRTGPLILILLFFGRNVFATKKLRSLLLVAISLFLSWYLIPRTGFGRFFLPTLGLLSVLAVHRLNIRPRPSFSLALVALSVVFGILYRGIANTKFVPVLLGRETKSAFLSRHLDFNLGNWYDTDAWVATNIGTEPYLVREVHNTYYLPGFFDHDSWADPDRCYKYILTQSSTASPQPYLQEVHVVPESYTRIYLNTACSLP